MSVFLKTTETSPVRDGYREQLKNVGSYLKTIRTQQGLSLQQVAKRTYIQLNQLRAIETGNWVQLPEAIYVQGFLRRYAQSLGLNDSAIANIVPAEPATFNPQWSNRSDFSIRRQGAAPSLINWWSKLTPLA
ncbi:MAG: helix-turn-helix domain-containing protein [Leptolyngbyaceae cyanobacterium]